jgi:uncharacterized membrane protein
MKNFSFDWKKWLLAAALVIAIAFLFITGRRSLLANSINKLRDTMATDDTKISVDQQVKVDEYHAAEHKADAVKEKADVIAEQGQKEFDGIGGKPADAPVLNDFMSKRKKKQ